MSKFCESRFYCKTTLTLCPCKFFKFEFVHGDVPSIFTYTPYFISKEKIEDGVDWTDSVYTLSTD
jgi:hypothetical protein